MPNFLIETSEGYRVMGLVEAGKFPLADGQEAWIFNDEAGNQVLTRIGADCDIERVILQAPEGLCLEFGVAGGNSIRGLAKSGRTIYGFDWWKGLPHAWNEADGKGSCLACKPHDLPGNVILVEGLFSDTLEVFLASHLGPVGFVHIDCDLYCPSIYVLHALVDRFIAGSLIAFDEIDLGHFGELQAWERYLNETGQRWEFVGKQHAWGQVYRCVDSKRR